MAIAIVDLDKVGGGAVVNFHHPNKSTVTVTVTVTVTMTVNVTVTVSYSFSEF
jgi:hypothetical protein